MKFVLLKSLLNSINQTQRKYGSRTELATESDDIIKNLCNCFEQILDHGRLKPFWSKLCDILSQDELSRFKRLSNVKTDRGRTRSWLRSTLNEHTLERYILMILSSDLTDYNEDSFLRDEEFSSVLPQSAAGLSTVLFALNVDDVILDEITLPDNLKVDPPPPIPVQPVAKEKLKKKKRTPMDFVSFDDDVDDTSSINSMPVDVALDLPSMLKTVDPSSQELFPVTLEPEKLQPRFQPSPTPETQKLKMILSNELEVVQNLKQMLTSERLAHTDEIKILEVKLNTLKEENDLIRSQMKKYNWRDDSTESGSSDPDRKLLQLAEMHAELLELNTKLQLELKGKDTIIQSLRTELVDLRGGADSTTAAGSSRILIWVPSVFLTGTGSDLHHVYQVFIRIQDEEWNVYRRYSQFYNLHKELKKCEGYAGLQFPPKRVIRNKDPLFVDSRRRQLQEYLRELLKTILSTNPVLAKGVDKNLLIRVVPFFGELPTQPNKQTNIPGEVYTGL